MGFLGSQGGLFPLLGGNDCPHSYFHKFNHDLTEYNLLRFTDGIFEAFYRSNGLNTPFVGGSVWESNIRLTL